MISISIIGTGNVATHLAKEFSNKEDIILKQVVGRNKLNLNKFNAYAQSISDFGTIQPVDVLIIAVSDDAIEPVSNAIPKTNNLVVHTSGSTSIGVLKKHKNKGVFYPLQTFTKNRNIDFKTVPICIESSDDKSYKLLEKIALKVSTNINRLNSTERSALHRAAVFGNNFGNHILTLTETICNENNLSFDLLKPLMTETIEKAFALGPQKSQTGPAKRGDYKIIKNQIELLTSKDQKDVYKILTQSLLQTYGKQKL